MAFCRGYGSPDFKPRVATTLVFGTDKVSISGKTVAKDFIASCYCWTRGIFSTEIRKFTIELLVLLSFFGFVIFGEF